MLALTERAGPKHDARMVRVARACRDTRRAGVGWVRVPWSASLTHLLVHAHHFLDVPVHGVAEGEASQALAQPLQQGQRTARHGTGRWGALWHAHTMVGR